MFGKKRNGPRAQRRIYSAAAQIGRLARMPSPNGAALDLRLTERSGKNQHWFITSGQWTSHVETHMSAPRMIYFLFSFRFLSFLLRFPFQSKDFLIPSPSHTAHEKNPIEWSHSNVILPKCLRTRWHLKFTTSTNTHASTDTETIPYLDGIFFLGVFKVLLSTPFYELAIFHFLFGFWRKTLLLLRRDRRM